MEIWLSNKTCCKMFCQRMYPDYISAKKMRENYEGNVFSPMGCRSFLAPWKDEMEIINLKADLIKVL